MHNDPKNPKWTDFLPLEPLFPEPQIVASYFAQSDTPPINEQLYSLGERAWDYLNNHTPPITKQLARRPKKEEYIMQRLKHLESVMVKKYGENARLKGQLRLAIALEKRYAGVRR